MQDQTGDDVDLFAGPGGWDEGNRMLGRPGPIGYELDPGACATAEAAGHKRVLADLLTMAPHETSGLVASPPCQGFSLAGLRRGIGDSAAILEEIARPRVEPQRLAEHCVDPRSALVVVPLHWVLHAYPAWTCWEQVPAVLPLWQACAERLRTEGYSAWAGLLYAEQAGVPQTRTRAFLLASRDKDVAPPVPTHSRYWNRTPTRLDPGVAKWVSMAEALGRGMTERPSMTVTGGGTTTGGAEPFGNGARQGMLRELDAGRWLVTSARAKATIRSQHEPAPTTTSGHDGAERRWVDADTREQAAEIAGNGWIGEGWYRSRDDSIRHFTDTAAWVFERSATTVQGDPRLPAPGHRCMVPDCHPDRESESMMAKAIRVTVQEAAVLQSFPADYPWQGGRTAQFGQVGNAVPPLLAAHVIAAVAT